MIIHFYVQDHQSTPIINLWTPIYLAIVVSCICTRNLPHVCRPTQWKLFAIVFYATYDFLMHFSQSLNAINEQFPLTWKMFIQLRYGCIGTINQFIHPIIIVLKQRKKI